jgi:hypothetical protein
MVSSCLDEEVENSPWGTENWAGSVGGKSKDQDDDQQHEGVDLEIEVSQISIRGKDIAHPIGQESSLNSTEHSVHHYAQWQQETSCWSGHSSQSGNDS